jgi:hypothetical protein
MNLEEMSDSKILSIAEPIMDNLMQASTSKVGDNYQSDYVMVF